MSQFDIIGTISESTTDTDVECIDDDDFYSQYADSSEDALHDHFCIDKQHTLDELFG